MIKFSTSLPLVVLCTALGIILFYIFGFTLGFISTIIATYLIHKFVLGERER